MKLYLFLLKRNIMLILLITVLVIWGITGTIISLTRVDKTYLIGVDEIGTRIISDSKDPLIKSEIVNFLRFFVSHLYNFSNQDFVTTVGTATSLMSAELWERERNALSSLMTDVKNKKINHFGVIQKIVKLNSKEYEIELDITIEEKLLKKHKKLKSVITIEQVTRTEQNPWGWQVDKINETYTH